MVNILFALLRPDDFLDLPNKVGLQCLYIFFFQLSDLQRKRHLLAYANWQYKWKIEEN